MDQNKVKLQSLFQQMLEKEIASKTINLWPELKTTLVMRNAKLTKQGDETVKNTNLSNRASRWAISAGVLIVCFLAFLLATPQGKVLAQEIQRYFTRSENNEKALQEMESDLQTQPYEIEAVPHDPEDPQTGCGPVIAPRCTLQQVQIRLAFDILLPQSLPGEMAFAGATAIDDGVVIKFEGEFGDLLLAETLANDSTPKSWMVGKDAVIQSVSIHDLPAEYVLGGWIGLGLSEDTLAWENNFPTRTLRWRMNDLEFTLVNIPARGVHAPVGLELPQLRQLAESITSTEFFKDSIDRPSLADAESQADFALNQPAWLPDRFTTAKTVYNSQHNAICQYYYINASEKTNPLVIAQSNWALPSVDELRAKAYYDGKEIPIAISQYSVNISGALNGLASLVETGLRIDFFCGGEPASAHRALLWQQDGYSYIIFASQDALDGRGFVTVNEMKLLAESLNGITPDPEDLAAPDPERLLSRTSAEGLFGEKLLLPSAMLSTVYFDHISLRNENSTTTYYSGQPVGDGRTYHVLITQEIGSPTPLADLKLAGGFKDTTVRSQSAIYQQACWENTLLADSSECRQTLIWSEDSTQFTIETYFPVLVPEEIVVAIAESMN